MASADEGPTAEETDGVTHEVVEQGIGRIEMVGDKHLFRSEFVTELDDAVSALEGDKSVNVAVVTSSGKFYSNGLDLGDVQSRSPEELMELVAQIQRFFAHLLSSRLTLVSASNGHAFGMGAMLHLCCDVRIARTERGFWCLPEVALGMPFTAGLSALVLDTVGQQAGTYLMTTGDRLDSDQQIRWGVSHHQCDVDSLQTNALDCARALVQNSSGAVRAIKSQAYSNAISALADETR